MAKARELGSGFGIEGKRLQILLFWTSSSRSLGLGVGGLIRGWGFGHIWLPWVFIDDPLHLLVMLYPGI